MQSGRGWRTQHLLGIVTIAALYLLIYADSFPPHVEQMVIHPPETARAANAVRSVERQPVRRCRMCVDVTRLCRRRICLKIDFGGSGKAWTGPVTPLR